VILNMIRRGEPGARLPWHDPLVLSTVAMLVWLLGSVVLAGVYKPARQGRKVAYLTLASFLFLVVALAGGTVLPHRPRWPAHGEEPGHAIGAGPAP